MADPLYELLAPYFDDASPPPAAREASAYLSRLSTLSFPDLTTSEPASLLQSASSQLRSLQALSKRSHKAVIASSTHLTNLSSLLPTFSAQTQELTASLPELESAASTFTTKYDRNSSNPVLDRRKRAALLSRNVDRVSDVLDLPSLLKSTITAAQAGNAASTSYSSALDVHTHIKRLRALYPQSELVGTITHQSEAEMQNLASILITSLQSPQLKLAAAMRTIGLIRRVAPELVGEDQHTLLKNTTLHSTKSLGLSSSNAGNNDGALGSLFLVCRLHMLHKTLEALDPLRDLADQELTAKPTQTSSSGSSSQSTERYLKRYIEIYREQSFGILSMYTSIFPEPTSSNTTSSDPLLPLPSPISTFTLHLVDLLEETLREYLPNITDPGTRESLLTQVLYCAGSLGRLGGEFGMMVAMLLEDEQAGGDEDDMEWVKVMKKHRVQASRLEILARGVGGGRKASGGDVLSPTIDGGGSGVAGPMLAG
jgi:hypothetical protein